MAFEGLGEVALVIGTDDETDRPRDVIPRLIGASRACPILHLLNDIRSTIVDQTNQPSVAIGLPVHRAANGDGTTARVSGAVNSAKSSPLLNGTTGGEDDILQIRGFPKLESCRITPIIQSGGEAKTLNRLPREADLRVRMS